MKTVKYFDSVNEANIARSFLESEGIEALTLNEYISEVTPYAFANPGMRPYIVVSDKDYERAVELVGADLPEEVACCPECGSKNLKYGITNKDGRQRAIKWAFVLLSLLGGCALGNIRASRYCGECNHEF